MKPRTALYGQLVVLALCIAISAYYYKVLPDQVPTHWNIEGKVDQYGSKWTNLVLMPCIVLSVLVLTPIIPALSPKNFEISRSGRAYTEVMLLVSALMGVVHVIILAGSSGAHFDMTRWMFGGIFLFFALMGNLLGKIKRNFYMGIKTPWTLADERVWNETHRQAAHLWFVAGLVGVVLTFLGLSMGLLIAYMVIVSCWPVLSSYLIYKRIVG